MVKGMASSILMRMRGMTLEFSLASLVPVVGPTGIRFLGSGWLASVDMHGIFHVVKSV